jgi:hypothetical protein
MGQQQLLLLVLATVIVGIATVVGIQAFSQNNVKSNADALMNDAVRIASDAQAWSQKAQPFGGPATFGDVGAATFADIGYQATAGVYSSANGDCELTGATGGNFVANCDNTTLGNEVEVTVDVAVNGGLGDEAVKGEILLLGGVDPTP